MERQTDMLRRNYSSGKQIGV